MHRAHTLKGKKDIQGINLSVAHFDNRINFMQVM